MIGLEPTHLTALTPKVSLSTNSNTLALCFVYCLGRPSIDMLDSYVGYMCYTQRRLVCNTRTLWITTNTLIIFPPGCFASRLPVGDSESASESAGDYLYIPYPAHRSRYPVGVWCRTPAAGGRGDICYITTNIHRMCTALDYRANSSRKAIIRANRPVASDRANPRIAYWNS